MSTVRENDPGSDSRVRQTGQSMASWLGGGDALSYAREIQWERLTPAGLVWVAPPCFIHATEPRA